METIETMPWSTPRLTLSRISRERFEKMVDAGIWGPQDHVELLDGLLVEMSPQGNLHAHAVRRLDRIPQRLCGDDAEVGTQLPFAASAFSLPEPDLVVTPGRLPRGRHPDRALLVIEVAESSLETDRTTKARLYASAQVPEYWVVDVQNERIEVLTEPLGDPYGNARVARRGDRIDLLGLPGQFVLVEDVFAD